MSHPHSDWKSESESDMILLAAFVTLLLCLGVFGILTLFVKLMPDDAPYWYLVLFLVVLISYGFGGAWLISLVLHGQS